MAGWVSGGAEASFFTAFRAGTGKIFWDLSSRILTFVLSIAVARELGAAGYGTFSVYWYSAWMIAQATDLGIHLVALRALSRASDAEANRPFWSALLAKGLLTALVIGAVVITLASGAFSFEISLAVSLLLAHLLGSWVEFLGISLRSRGRIAREGLVLMTLRLAWLLAAVWAIGRGARLSDLGAMIALSGIPALAIGILFIGRSGWLRRGAAEESPRFETARVLREALPLGIVSAITLVYLRADLLIVSSLRGAAEAGLFQSAFRLFEATFVLSGGIAAGTFPLLAARVGAKGAESLARFLLGLLMAVAIPVASVLALFPGPILAVVYGSGFEGAARPLSYLGIALLAVFANALTTHLLIAAGRNRQLVFAISTRLLCGIALDLALVPRFGAAGASIAVAAAEWSLLAVSGFAAADLLGLSLSPRRGVAREEVSPCS